MIAEKRIVKASRLAQHRSTERLSKGDVVRRCLVSGKRLPKEALVRFVISPDGLVVPDLGGDLPGRGFWVSMRRDAVETALRKKLFQRVARRAVTAAADLPERLEEQVRSRCLRLLELIRRCGGLISGFDQVRAALKAGRASVYVAACDASEDGRGKILTIMRALTGGPGCALDVVNAFTKAELGLILGRDQAVHLCVLGERAEHRALALRLKKDAGVLVSYRGSDDVAALPIDAAAPGSQTALRDGWR